MRLVEIRGRGDWYHGSPDIREIRQQGNFSKKTMSVSYISDVNTWNQLQSQLSSLSNEDPEYYEILQKKSELIAYMEIPSPIFFTSALKVAKTYANVSRAFDYQNAQPGVITAHIDPGKNLKISAGGDSFKGISKDAVFSALEKSGIPKDDIENTMMKFIRYIRNNKLRTDDLAAIAHHYQFDTVDVTNVRDSYMGGSLTSTVRIVFDPSKITIIS